MEGELNNLTTNNTKITFNNTPNNVQQSDELKADPLYYRQMGTAYSLGKVVKRSVIAVGLVITATSGGIMASNAFSNSYVKSPTVTDISVLGEKDNPNAINFSFSITKNENNYTVLFTLADLKGEYLYSFRAKEIKSYNDVVTDLEAGKKYQYKISFTNDIDLVRELNKGIVATTNN